MELVIGKATFTGRHPGRSPEYQRLLTGQRKAAGRAPVSVFRWDCRRLTGLIRPPTFVALPLRVTGVWPDAQTGAVDAAAAEARMKDFGARVDPRPDAVPVALRIAFPPVQFAVPWARFRHLMTPALSFHLLAWPDYLDLMVTPADPPPIGEVMLSLPVAVLFQAIVTGRCAPPETTGDPISGAELREVSVKDTATLPAAEKAFVDGWTEQHGTLVAEGGALPSDEDRRARDAASARDREAWRARLSGA